MYRGLADLMNCLDSYQGQTATLIAVWIGLLSAAPGMLPLSHGLKYILEAFPNHIPVKIWSADSTV